MNFVLVVILLYWQKAQLPQRDSASATPVFLGSLTESCTSMNTAFVLQLYNTLAKLVSTLSANKPCDIRTLSWIGHSGHSRSSLLVAEESRTLCRRNVQLMPTLFLKLTKRWQREKRQIRRYQQPHSSLKTPRQETPSNIYKLFLLPATKSYWPTFLSLTVWVYVHYFSFNYVWKSNPLNLKLLVRRPSLKFYMI